MGCGSSRHDTGLEAVDDSVHVMLSHDKRRMERKGEAQHGYVPRAEHPLLRPKAVQATEEDATDGPSDANGPEETKEQQS
eukprot:Nitzschia sp. Nitz4//NODE_542_length_12750_cov_80.145333//2156//2395//NITZ4_additional_000080-RA//-1//CDS//3329531970//661//frame0